MKMRKNILALTLGTICVLPMALAQGPAPTQPQVNVSNAVVPTAASGPVIQNTIKDPGTGNKFEKEITPLLRDISKKRSQLEIRKLERELEKLDEDAAKAQNEAQAKANPNINSNFVPIPTPQNSANMPTNSMSEMSHSNGVRVIMIYGNTTNLYAKISLGDQGGYPVRKGDILPDGRMVSNITLNYIEVKEIGKKKSAPEIIPVRGPYIATEGGTMNAVPSIPTSLPSQLATPAR